MGFSTPAVKPADVPIRAMAAAAVIESYPSAMMIGSSTGNVDQRQLLGADE